MSGKIRVDFNRPVGRRLLQGVVANSVCALAVVAALGASEAYTQEHLSQPDASVLVVPPRGVLVASDAVPAPLEIPTVPTETNSILPAATVDVPPSAPEVTAAPPPPVVVPEPPKATAEILPPPPAPPTPSDILGLSGKEHAKERAKAEKCLANAVYFESRGELMRGQVAVAQVVLNRVFSPYYPKDVCGVVYQNAERHLSCQFTFACDGKSKAITERGAWSRAQRVAKQALDGKVWIASVAKSTHYHAYWVNPSWVAEMKKMYRYGVHTFYRPHRWGDGAQEAGWVTPEMALYKPVESKQQTPPTPAKPVTKNETPAPAVTQAKASTSANTAKPAPAVAQTKAAVADAKAKTAAETAAKTAAVKPQSKPTASDSKSKTVSSQPAAQAKSSANDGKAKPVSANPKVKTSAADSKAKPAVNAQPKNAQPKTSAADNKAKALQSDAQAKASQRISTQ